MLPLASRACMMRLSFLRSVSARSSHLAIRYRRRPHIQLPSFFHTHTPSRQSERDTSAVTHIEYMHRAMAANQGRAVSVQKLPKRVTEADLRAFFEKKGFPIADVYMVYQPIIMAPCPSCVIVFAEGIVPDDVVDACQGHTLLGRHLILASHWHHAVDTTPNHFGRHVGMQGWYATREPESDAINLRGLLTVPAQDTVDDIVQGKVISTFNLPPPRQVSNFSFNEFLYLILHGHDVFGFGDWGYWPSRNPKVSGWILGILFKSEEEANIARDALDGQMLGGLRIRARNSSDGWNHLSQDELWKTVHGKHDRKKWGSLDAVA